MAEINEAYAALTRDGGLGGMAGRRAAGGPDVASRGGPGDGRAAGAVPRRGGPPRPKATRPVTARLDTTDTVRPRNQPLRPHGGSQRGSVLRGQPPVRASHIVREPPRASTPTGPLARGRLRNFQPPVSPPLGDALDRELEFGKFHGHTLGQVAAFEPSYIDWLATTITRDRDLVAAARVIRDDLDRRGVVRRPRAPAEPQRAGRPA